MAVPSAPTKIWLIRIVWHILLVNHATERGTTRPEGGQSPSADGDGIRRADVPHIEKVERMFEQGNAAGALRQLDNMIRDSPNSPHMYLQKSMILTELKKFKAAADCCKQALQLDKNYGPAYGTLGLILRRNGKPAKAILYLNKAIKITKREGPSYSLFVLYNNKGAALSDMFKWEESVRWYDKAIDLDPSQVSTHINKYVSLLFMGRSEEAKKCLAVASKIDPELTLRLVVQINTQINTQISARLNAAHPSDFSDFQTSGVD